MCHTLVIYTLLSNRHIQNLDLQTWANPESFFRGVQILDIYFLSHFFALVIIFYRGEMGRPSSADQRNAISMAFHWCTDEGLIFQGVQTPCPLPLEPRINMNTDGIQ